MTHAAYVCRFGRQSFSEYMGRRPSMLEWKLFERAIQDILEIEYEAKPAELRSEDD